MTRSIVVTVDQWSREQPGGIGTYLRGLFDGLATLRDEGELVDDVTGLGARGAVAATRMPVVTAALDVRALTVLWRFVPVGVPHTADVVHASSMAGPFRGGRRGAIHSVVVHDVLWRDHPDAFTTRARRFHEQRLRQIVGRSELRVLVTSAALASQLASCGVEEQRLRVVRLGVDALVASEDPAVVLRRRGIDPSVVPGRYTLVVGTIQPRRNLERLIRAHREAVRTAPELGPLVVVGGWSPSWGHVDLADAVVVGEADAPTLAALVSGARVCAYVPLAEGWGFPPLEALAAGRPVVASTTVPSVADLDVVQLVEPLDDTSIRDGLLRAVRESDDDEAQAHRRAAVAAHTWERCARDHLAAWS